MSGGDDWVWWIVAAAVAVIFISYLIYGFLRPFLSRKMKQEIEEEVEDDEPLESP